VQWQARSANSSGDPPAPAPNASSKALMENARHLLKKTTANSARPEVKTNHEVAKYVFDHRSEALFMYKIRESITDKLPDNLATATSESFWRSLRQQCFSACTQMLDTAEAGMSGGPLLSSFLLIANEVRSKSDLEMAWVDSSTLSSDPRLRNRKLQRPLHCTDTQSTCILSHKVRWWFR